MVLICLLTVRQIPNDLLDVIRSENTWTFMFKFVRAVFPMLIILRFADGKDPAMDKLYYYVRRMDETLKNSKSILDDIEKMTNDPSWFALGNFKKHSKKKAAHIADILDGDSDDNTYDTSEESTEDDDDTETESEEEKSKDDNSAYSSSTSLGQRVVNLWMKRRERLVTDMAIVGWMLCPMPLVHADATQNTTLTEKSAFKRFVKKWYCSGMVDNSQEYCDFMSRFENELYEFRTKSGKYDEPYIWNENDPDLLQGRSHHWHHKHSLIRTTYLGKTACRICSKLVGMGSAERSWGDVKHLKSSKRSHLSSQAVEKQATIYGASCMVDAQLKRNQCKQDSVNQFRFWDEADFREEFDMLAHQAEVLAEPRYIKCYVEAWETKEIRNKDIVTQTKFLHKYGGLEFDDVDNPGCHYFIDKNELSFSRREGWCVKAYSDPEYQSDWDPWAIAGSDNTLQDCLYVYYQGRPETNVVPLVNPDQRELLSELVQTVAEKVSATNAKDPILPTATAGYSRKARVPNDSRLPSSPSRLAMNRRATTASSPALRNTRLTSAGRGPSASTRTSTSSRVNRLQPPPVVRNVPDSVQVICAPSVVNAETPPSRDETNSISPLMVDSPKPVANNFTNSQIASKPGEIICVGCGKTAGKNHQCDKCNAYVHVTCGSPIGEEGYNQIVRCHACVNTYPVQPHEKPF